MTNLCDDGEILWITFAMYCFDLEAQKNIFRYYVE